MSQSTSVRNPFLLMMHPEVVLAAMEKSERLAQLNRHLCRPLDRNMPATPKEGASAGLADAADDAADDIN